MVRLLLALLISAAACVGGLFFLAYGYRIEPQTEVYSARPALDAQGRLKNIHLRLDVYPGTSGRKQIPVLLIGGGGWSLGLTQRDTVSRWTGLLTDARFRVFSMEYRSVDCGLLAGMTKALPEHSCFPHPARLEDLDSAVQYLHEHAERFGIDARKLILIGDSSGAHSAGLYALRSSDPRCKGLATCGHPVAGVVSFAGPLDLYKTVQVNPAFKVLVSRLLNLDLPRMERAASGIGPESELLRDADPASHLHADSPPFLLVHSRSDVLVPSEASRSFRDNAEKVVKAGPLVCEGITYNQVHKIALPDSIQPASHAVFYAVIGVSGLTYLESWLPQAFVDALYRVKSAAGTEDAAPVLGMGAPPEASVQMRRDLSALSRQMRAWMACRADAAVR